MATKQISIRLDEHALDILDAACDGDGPSRAGYLERLLEHDVREWRAAYTLMRSAGWSPPELRALMDVLNGVWLTGSSPTHIALEMADAWRLNRTPEQHGVDDEERWGELVAQVRERDDIAAAAATLARVFWWGNADLESRIMAES